MEELAANPIAFTIDTNRSDGPHSSAPARWSSRPRDMALEELRVLQEARKR
jgi:hypothetical protein